MGFGPLDHYLPSIVLGYFHVSLIYSITIRKVDSTETSKRIQWPLVPIIGRKITILFMFSLLQLSVYWPSDSINQPID